MKKIMGPGKAIVEFDKKKGIKFSEEAMASLNLKLLEIENTNSFSVPDAGLVRDRNHHSVYIYKEGFFRLVKVNIIRPFKTGKMFLVRPKGEIPPGSKLLGQNANLVHVAEIYIKHN